MKRKITFFLLIIALALIQATLAHDVAFFGVRPDLLFFAAIFASLYFELLPALIFCLFAGFLKDSFLGVTLNTFLFPLWCIAIKQLARSVSIDNEFVASGLVLVAVFINDILIRVIFSPPVNPIPLGVFLKIIILGPVYTALVSFFMFRSAPFRKVINANYL